MPFARSKIFFWFAVFAVALLVMARPASAETIAPTSSGWFLQWGGTISYGSVALVCAKDITVSSWPTTNTYECIDVVQGATTGSYRVKACLKTNPTTCSYTNRTSYYAGTCPPNQGWTLTDGMCVRPDCVEPEVRSVSTGLCVACQDDGSTYVSGWFDIGDNPSVSHPPLSTCSANGCGAEYNGYSISMRGLVNGIYHYYAQGSYLNTGEVCSAGIPTPSVVTSTADTCAEGQSSITYNGKLACLNPSGDIENPNSAAAIAGASVAATSAVIGAGTIAEAAGLSPSAVENAQGTAAGIIGSGGYGNDIVTDSFCFTNPGNPICTGLVTNPDGTPTQESVDLCASNPNIPACVNFCTTNPTSSICVDLDYGSVEDSVLETKDINVAISPVQVGGAGSCPAPSPMVLRGQTYFFKWDTYCDYATGIKPILLAFAWLSAAGLLVGGFKT